jgi:hypothetical protein
LDSYWLRLCLAASERKQAAETERFRESEEPDIGITRDSS